MSLSSDFFGAGSGAFGLIPTFPPAGQWSKGTIRPSYRVQGPLGDGDYFVMFYSGTAGASSIAYHNNVGVHQWTKLGSDFSGGQYFLGFLLDGDTLWTVVNLTTGDCYFGSVTVSTGVGGALGPAVGFAPASEITQTWMGGAAQATMYKEAATGDIMCVCQGSSNSQILRRDISGVTSVVDTAPGVNISGYILVDDFTDTWWTFKTYWDDGVGQFPQRSTILSVKRKIGSEWSHYDFPYVPAGQIGLPGGSSNENTSIFEWDGFWFMGAWGDDAFSITKFSKTTLQISIAALLKNYGITA